MTEITSIPEIITNETKLVQYKIPPISKIFPLSMQDINNLVPSYDTFSTKPDNFLYQQRQRFQQASTVLIDCSGFSVYGGNVDVNQYWGLGDAVIDLRYAHLLARKSPEKRVVIMIPSKLANMRLLDKPENVEYTTQTDLEKINIPLGFPDQNNLFFVAFDSRLQLNTTLSKWEKKHSQYSEIEETQISDQEVTKLDIEENYKSLNLPHNEHYQLQDLKNAIRLHLLGIPINEDDLLRPLVNVPGNVERKVDYVIAPDAREFEMPGNDKSAKSLSVDKWKKVFATLPRDKTLSIIEGVTHPEYCRQVYQAAIEAGHKVSLVRTPTLDDFCISVMEGDMFIAMDSGTTHLANDVVLAASQVNRNIGLLQILNNTLASSNWYSVHGNEKSISTLVWGKLINRSIIEQNKIEKCDISTISANTIVEAIKAASNNTDNFVKDSRQLVTV